MFGSLLPSLLTSVPGPRSVALADELSRAECPALTARRARRAEQTGASHDPIALARSSGRQRARCRRQRVRRPDRRLRGRAVCTPPPARSYGRSSSSSTSWSTRSAISSPRTARSHCSRELARIAPFRARSILGLSGADAIEAALKTALLATKRPGVIAFEGGYHGLSHGPLAACGYGEGFRAPFAEQLNPHVRFAPFATQPARSRARARRRRAAHRRARRTCRRTVGRAAARTRRCPCARRRLSAAARPARARAPAGRDRRRDLHRSRAHRPPVHAIERKGSRPTSCVSAKVSAAASRSAPASAAKR